MNTGHFTHHRHAVEQRPSAVRSQQHVVAAPRLVIHRSLIAAVWAVGLAATAACSDRSPSGRSAGSSNPAADSALHAHLVAQQPVLDSLVLIFRKRAQLLTVTRTGAIPSEVRDGKVITPNRNERLHDLLVQAQVDAAFSDARYPHCVFVRFDSTPERQRGFVNVGEGCTIPSTDSTLATAPGQGDWYLYATR